jgi:hypothetical protein
VGDTKTLKDYIMTKEMLAEQLNGREYGNEIEPFEARAAEDNGLVAVFGYSDDVTEFRGVIDEEVGCCELEFTKNGVFKAEDDEEVLSKYDNPVSFNKIKAVWNPKDQSGNVFACWGYETEIPHATFDIMEDGELYCRGIVFSINDLK